jgi:predicted O-methyltransferase YrrM
MARLLREGWRDDYDFAFIDADKTGYVDYFEACLQLVRPGGLILVDNTLWDGKVADPSAGDDDTAAIRAFNRRVAADERVDLSLLPLADGVTVLRRKV